MPDMSDNGIYYVDHPFNISLYIEGYSTVQLSEACLSAGCIENTENGILYDLIQTANIEPFADHKIYLGISDALSPDLYAFSYDKETGEYSRNESYEGLNALFTLPIDKDKADSKKAAEILARSNSQLSSENDGYPEDVLDIMEKIKSDPEHIDKYAAPDESSTKIVTPDDYADYSYEYERPDGITASYCFDLNVIHFDGEGDTHIECIDGTKPPPE